jgi:hypothetical protein
MVSLRRLGFSALKLRVRNGPQKKIAQPPMLVQPSAPSTLALTRSPSAGRQSCGRKLSGRKADLDRLRTLLVLFAFSILPSAALFLSSWPLQGTFGLCAVRRPATGRERRSTVYSEIRTNCLPLFSPENSLARAAGAFSKPCTMSTRSLIRPSANHAASATVASLARVM